MTNQYFISINLLFGFGNDNDDAAALIIYSSNNMMINAVQCCAAAAFTQSQMIAKSQMELRG
jgi:hypothetical protein